MKSFFLIHPKVPFLGRLGFMGLGYFFWQMMSVQRNSQVSPKTAPKFPKKVCADGEEHETCALRKHFAPYESGFCKKGKEIVQIRKIFFFCIIFMSNLHRKIFSSNFYFAFESLSLVIYIYIFITWSEYISNSPSKSILLSSTTIMHHDTSFKNKI